MEQHQIGAVDPYAPCLPEMYRELEGLELALVQERQRVTALQEAKLTCEAAHERDIAALEGMLEQVTEERNRLVSENLRLAEENAALRGTAEEVLRAGVALGCTAEVARERDWLACENVRLREENASLRDREAGIAGSQSAESCLTKRVVYVPELDCSTPTSVPSDMRSCQEPDMDRSTSASQFSDEAAGMEHLRALLRA
mmetsp:Transcript_109856/g.309824  ORF Transcript_109856/g.309824 Transcript_109856/m.309824 type:complete len:200 (-) Transcript_109856:70-669(-)